MVSYTYKIQNKTNHTQATQSDWTGSKTKTTCVSLARRTPGSPHRRAEATGHLQLKVKCSCCGHAKWVVFSKSKPFLPTFGVLLRAKIAGVPRLRHVSVESGVRLVGPEAWHSCRQLRIVKLPSTVVTISEAVNCLIVSLLLVAESLAAKPLMSASHCSGSIPLKMSPIGLAAAPSLGITSSEAVSTLPSLPCTWSPCPSELLSQPTARELALGCLSSTGQPH